MPGEWTGKYYPQETGTFNTLLRLGKAATFHRKVINDLLKYFQTGEINIPPNFEGELPRFVRPRLVGIGEKLLAPIAISRRNDLLIPFIKEVYMSFSVVHVEEDIPLWKEIGPSVDNPYEGGNIQYYFTSFLTVPENLANLTQDILSPSLAISRAPGESMEELMAKQRETLLRNSKSQES